MPVVDPKCLEVEHRVAGVTSEKEEFSRLLKAKIDELGLSDKVEPTDAHSANLTVSLLQELISALTTDTNTSASQSSNCSDSSVPLNNADTVCNSSVQSPKFRKGYQVSLYVALLHHYAIYLKVLSPVSNSEIFI
jgi:hypothetical protein